MSARVRQGCHLAALATLLISLWMVAPASAAEYVPPAGKVWAGLTGGTSIEPWQKLTNHHPPVFEDFLTWNTGTSWLSNPAPNFRSRLALHMSTAPGYAQPGVISPQGIALGRSDKYLVVMNRNLAHSRRIFYIRIMGEPNGYWNAYCPFNADGSSRGPQNSTHFYRQAWRRTVLILRGGSLRTIDRKLRGLGMPSVRTKLSRSAVLPRPKVTFIWAPQTSGDPNIAANEPGQFWPGSQYVDWIGTDFYAGDNFTYLDQYYQNWETAGKPFDLSEWAVVHSDDPSFVHSIFGWVRSHPHVRMFNYYQGYGPKDPANPKDYPHSMAALRQELHTTKFPQYPDEYAHPPKHHHHHHHKHPKPPPPPKPPKPGPPPNKPLLCINLLKLLHLCIPGP